MTLLKASKPIFWSMIHHYADLATIWWPTAFSKRTSVWKNLQLLKTCQDSVNHCEAIQAPRLSTTKSLQILHQIQIWWVGGQEESTWFHGWEGPWRQTRGKIKWATSAWYLFLKLIFTALTTPCSYPIHQITSGLYFYDYARQGRGFLSGPQAQAHVSLYRCVLWLTGVWYCATCRTSFVKAAFNIAKYNQLDHAAKLLEVLQGLNLDNGDQGELVTMLLVLLAWDKVVNQAHNLQSHEQHHVKLVDPMDQLLNSNWHSEVHDAKPYQLQMGDDNKSFNKTFKDATVYFMLISLSL